MNEIKKQKAYDLKIDKQVDKFLDKKQKLTYFLISASMVVLAFMLKFAIDHKNEIINLFYLMIAASLFALVTSGLSILCLYLEHKSHRFHLKYRYENKNWEDLKKSEKDLWDCVNYWSSFSFSSALLCLFVEILFVIFFFIYYFKNQIK